VSIEVGVEGGVELTASPREEGEGEGGSGQLRLMEGDLTRLDCHVTAAHPPPAFSWRGPAQAARVRKNVGEEVEEGAGQGRGNLTVIQQVRETEYWGQGVGSVTSLAWLAHRLIWS
jgi:hypothetical protein